MADTIDNNAMQKAAEHLIRHNAAGHIIHTVTLTLNGQHGGVDVTLYGFEEEAVNGELLPNEIEETVVAR